MNSEQQDPPQTGESDAQPEAAWTEAEREQIRYMVRALVTFLVLVGLTSGVMMVVINYILG